MAIWRSRSGPRCSDRFKAGDLRLLVCSDVAARGLDIADMSHVFNFDVPTSPEDYVHRIGRTGRAGRSGRAFTIAVPEDGKYVALIEKLIGKTIPRINVDTVEVAELEEDDRAARRRRGGRGRPVEGRAGGGRGRGRGGDRGVVRDERPAHADRTQPIRPHADRSASGEEFRAGNPGDQTKPREDYRPRREHRPEADPERPLQRADRPQHIEGPDAAAQRPPSAGSRRQRGPARPPREVDTPVVGMGDHVPAFLLRDVPLRKKA